MVLDRSEKDLEELCSSLATDEEKRRCWEVYRYFTEKRTGAQAGCVRELEAEGGRGQSCEDLDKLERMVFELMSTGRTRDLYSVLKVESEIAKRNGRALGSTYQCTLEEQEHLDHINYLRQRADELFNEMDTNKNGFVDREEFLHAMALLRDELGWDEAELGTVFSAIDCHGHVSREQFADILIAEELRDPSADAELLRHLAHQRPNWWTECPNAVASI